MLRAIGAVALLALVTVSAACGVTRTMHTIDLANGRFDHHAVFGLTPPRVRALLGRPDREEGDVTNFHFAWGPDPKLDYGVLFVHRGRYEHARTLVFETGSYIDPKVGNILALRPAAFLAAIRTHYGDVYQLVKPLHRDRFGTDIGELAQRHGPLHITFGSEPKLGTFVTVWHA